MNSIKKQTIRLDEDADLKSVAPQGVGSASLSVCAKKVYTCTCGKAFTNPQAFNGHKSQCKIHRLALGKPILPSHLLGKTHKPYIEKNENPEKWEKTKLKISKALKGKSHQQTEETKRKISETCKRNKKSGGYRPGSGRGKKGWYKGIFCDSQYELGYLIYCIDHNILIKRNTVFYPYIYNGKEHKYLPDFIVDNRLIEIKGYYRDIDDIKLAAVTDKSIQILYPKDLVFVSEYLKKVYNKDINHIYTEYDKK